MTLGEFRAMFLDFVIRKDVTADQALRLINLAKLGLQRDYDLTFAKSRLDSQTYVTGGFALPIDFKKFFGENSVILTDGSGRLVPLTGTTERVELNRLSSRGPRQSTIVNPSPAISRLANVGYYAEFLNGSNVATLFLTPESDGLVFSVVYIAWLPDYVNDGEEDFLLSKARDVLLFATMEVYNSFAHTEEKIPIDQNIKAMKMDKLSEYCATLERSGTYIYEG